MAVRRRRWPLLGLAAAVFVVLAGVALLWFQPQKLLYDTTVDEALPTIEVEAGADASPGVPADSVQLVELASGTFISREHETQGTARILRLPDGRLIVRFEDFATSNGPVLVVWLSGNPATGPDEAFPGHHVDLGPLKGNVGDQNYVVPDGVDPTDFASVVVWCDRFDVSFGAADLHTTA